MAHLLHFLSSLPSNPLVRVAALPSILGAAAGFTSFWRLGRLSHRVFGVPVAESLMQFASAGMLTCICHPEAAQEGSAGGWNGQDGWAPEGDRCAACGLAVMRSTENVDREMTASEIAEHVDLLAAAGVAAGRGGVPVGVTNVWQFEESLRRSVRESMLGSRDYTSEPREVH